MKKVAWLALVATLLGAGGYAGVYLYRWEWTRAQFSGLVFIGAEVALVGVVLLRKLRQLDERFDHREQQVDPVVLDRLRRTRAPKDRFGWLDETLTRTNVFITFVVSGGIVLSGAAWVIDKVAGHTVTARRERRLAGSLATVALPASPLVADEAELLAHDLPALDDPDLRLLVGDRMVR
ncbi:hypothetical protein HC251_12620 [Iamia sp. SCSIO 61187]|uniref:hypothetical protein n=1 Tax=Iamia sp. SCSIO 61187 TaxID=2722752 RepID=UPI001C62E72A|nr:hypothetical protein [Iamia sp. SCSIO 61187]QYG93189.1 hypothetical protein HC251_12620 [Iamia sp. SCSIO 61187]